jgi:hypothetical protein
MSQDILLPILVLILVFASGLAGLAYHTWNPGPEGGSETRDLINRLTGLVATLSALVLGLLIASTNTFYNTQKAELQTISVKVLELDGVLRRYGPDADPVRGILKDIVRSSYDGLWQADSATPTMPLIEQAVERMDSLFVALNALRESAPASHQYLLATAAGFAGSINDQRLQMALQLNDSLSWPFMTILVSWACLLFFGFGLLARVNGAGVAALGVGAVSVASAIFLIVELSTPYSGMLRLSPAPVLQTLEVLNR